MDHTFEEIGPRDPRYSGSHAEMTSRGMSADQAAEGLSAAIRDLNRARHETLTEAGAAQIASLVGLREDVARQIEMHAIVTGVFTAWDAARTYYGDADDMLRELVFMPLSLAAGMRIYREVAKIDRVGGCPMIPSKIAELIRDVLTEMADD